MSQWESAGEEEWPVQSLNERGTWVWDEGAQNISNPVYPGTVLHLA
jgi:hypothetical protein